MTSPLSFGNPDNPFSEAEIFPQHRIACDLVRRPAADVIRYMSAFSAEVTIKEVDASRTLRTINLGCTAPFEAGLGMYLNEAALLIDKHIQEVTNIGAALRLGDTVVDNTVTKRWIQLRHPEGKGFGVSGVSRLLPDGSFEKWNNVTLCIQPRDQNIKAEIWGEITDNDGSNSAQLLREGKGLCFEAYYESMYRAISRTLEKRQSPLT